MWLKAPRLPARVHPRSRGAASSAPHCMAIKQGPSPLTRGSQAVMAPPSLRAGSIPAHAGQPAGQHARRARRGVHPRSRGAASFDSVATALVKGPSPLTRGSQPERHTDTTWRGSIPAHAGQPSRLTWALMIARVHPRSRGAARCTVVDHAVSSGPSPLTRGSRCDSTPAGLCCGSIPAHAGQPYPGGPDGRDSRVHPRSRGAAHDSEVTANVTTGPSPLTRGSHHARRRSWMRTGSIPAHAGQPAK